MKPRCAISAGTCTRTAHRNEPLGPSESTSRGRARGRKYGVQGRINAAIDLVPAVHPSAVGGVRFHGFSDSHHRVRGLVHVGPGFSTHPRQNRSTVGGALFGHHGFYFVPVNVGLNLTP